MYFLTNIKIPTEGPFRHGGTHTTNPSVSAKNVL